MKKKYFGDLLLVIDMQNVYSKNQKWACWQSEKISENIVKIIESQKCNVAFTSFVENKKAKGVWKNYNAENHDVNSDKFLCDYFPKLLPYLSRFRFLPKALILRLKTKN